MNDTTGTAFEDLLAANASYSDNHADELKGFDGIARAGVAIVTCMDSRIEPLKMVGLTHGDAKIFRNPGGRVTDAALEALVLAVHLLNVRRVLIVPHTRCAMTKMSENELREKISEISGQDAWWQHFHVVPDQHAALVEDVHRVTSHPLIQGRAEVGGFLYDVDNGRLQQLV
ncbi:beta-class carbonic anhydrase [Ornithinimicrobium tianjinense]|uniref:carbonic anhydrase n=1 Tax=Ornithinimicrobium tianjinense TaxID=1195761 RepID=A0A917BY06_9MICO|nr:carbonic anhydrase [Ornithinimicrobium tianjinense]GGF59238.1 carbonic anhydrase [Ornithinimicrobium tianjinense]